MSEKSVKGRFSVRTIPMMVISKEKSETPIEPSTIRQWLSKNVMLLATMSGVFVGVVEGMFVNI